MKISATKAYGNFGSGSLLGAYAVQAQSAAPAKTSSIEAPEVTANQLKARLLTLSDKLKPFADLNGSFGSSSSNSAVDAGDDGQDTDPTPTDPTQPERVKVKFKGDSKPLKFARQLNRALNKGVSDEDSQLLKGQNVSGDVNVTVGKGPDKLKFSIHVDENTTAQDFVDEFNSKAQGRAQADFQDANPAPDGSPPPANRKLHIAISTTAQQPTDGDSTPPITNTDVLGSSVLSGANLDSESISKDLKNFATEFNRLVKLSNSGNDGSNVLAATSVDERAILDIRGAIDSATSSNGAVAVSDLFKKGSGGTISLNEQNLKRLAEEDPDSVVDALRNLAKDVHGNGGVVQQYTGRKNLVDRAITNVEAQLAQAQTTASTGTTPTASTTSQVKRFEDTVPTIANVVGSKVRSVA